MFSIGITGGIGSGKSLVCKVLEHLAYPVFYADESAKQNMLENLDLINAIVKTFGEKAYIDKQLNRNYLSSQVFSKPELREKLNALVHPTVFQSYDAWKKQQNSPIVFNESALLFETGSYKRFDQVWLVTADMETRIERVMKRDNVSREDVLARMKSQLSDEEKIEFGPKIIENNNDSRVLPQILELISELSPR
ncbi:MAG: Dephospho-CoA kinase [Crocinitomicaceae bacterium]|jgi:dephospho-CoA kinase|nr:Dephospho-CoA kinase [Crocinitomicaceae bacterium]